MGYLPALSGLARSGVTYCGWTAPAFVVTIGGTTRTSSVMLDGWAITDRLSAASVCTFSVKGITPTLGQDVKIRFAGANDWLFGGVLLQAEAELVNASTAIWHCTATGYAWLLQQFTVERTFTNTSINTILANLIADYASSDFSTGYCPHDDRVTVAFSGTTLTEALSQLAALIPNGGGWWEVTHDKRVNLCTTYPHASYSFTNTTQAHALRVVKDLTQVRTRTRVSGAETALTAAAEVGATSISVAEIGWFQLSQIGASSGEALLGTNVIGYTGTSSADNLAYGPGTLTGVTGLTADVAEGERVATMYTDNDTTAQTALAATLGSPASGIVTHWITDSTLSLAACKARAEADTAQFGSAVTTMEYQTADRHTRVGRLISASVTLPVTLSGDYLVQQVMTTPRRLAAGAVVDLTRSVAAGATNQQLNDVLQRVN